MESEYSRGIIITGTVETTDGKYGPVMIRTSTGKRVNWSDLLDENDVGRTVKVSIDVEGLGKIGKPGDGE